MYVLKRATRKARDLEHHPRHHAQGQRRTIAKMSEVAALQITLAPSSPFSNLSHK
jgi:hypothetical protein